MIVNGYAVLDAFVTALRLVVAVLVVTLAVRGWRDRRSGGEERNYLLVSLALLLLVLNVVSWPILYLLLQSYVPEWPGVMCIYGVTQVGSGSVGPSRFLPGLLRLLQVLKPALVFGSGAWLTLYLANRGTATAPLWGRVLLVVFGVGVLAGVDAAAEGAYLLIPKHEEFLAAGCCTDMDPDTSRLAPAPLVPGAARDGLRVAYYAVNAGMILLLLFALRRLARRPGLPPLSPLLAGAVVAAVISGAFLVDVAAPAWLHLPQHHCAYDLIPRVPEAVVAAASFVAGTFAVGWACVAGWFARCGETQPALPGMVRRLLLGGLFGHAGALALVVVEFAVA